MPKHEPPKQVEPSASSSSSSMNDLLCLLGRFHQASNLILGTAGGAMDLGNNVGAKAGATVEASAAGQKPINDTAPAPSQVAAKKSSNESLENAQVVGHLPVENNPNDRPGKTLEDFEKETFAKLEAREKAKKCHPTPKGKAL